LIGRYRNASDLRDVRLRLSGRSARERRSFAYENLRFPANSDDNDFLPRLWATRRVGWLMEQMRSNGEARELRDEVVDLGTRYGIVTPYTSYLALEPGAVVTDADAATRTNRDSGFITNGTANRRPRPSPQQARKTGTSGGSVGGAGAGGNVSTAPVDASPPVLMPTPMPAPMPTTGAAAVRDSKRERARQESVRAEEDESSAAASAVMRKVAGKTFYLRDGVWTDADYKADASVPETTLVFGSDAYFELLKRERKLAEFFALGERVVVVYKGQVYRVNAAP
jgi:Ca-activated chloride channel family protein